MSTGKTLLVCAVILLAAAGLLAVVFNTEPTATRGGATKETAMLVEVVEAEGGTFRPTIVAMGNVVPEREVTLSPRVGGEVVARAEAFTPGGFVQRGELLLRIDPSDFENVLAQRRSDLARALADLELEEGRRDVARQDYELLGETLTGENEDLVLREPQLQTARAQVESARAAVAQAELDLERTAIRAPFDAHVLRRQVDVGSQVAPGDALGRIVGVDRYWVEVAVPPAKLRFVSIPEAPGEAGSAVKVRDRAAWPAGAYRDGSVDELVGELAGETRMARVLVTVPDPLARDSGDADVPPLMIGSFVEARIEGEPIPGVVRLDRDYVRKDDTVWVMADGRLQIRDAEVVFRDARYAYVAGGVEAGDRVVTTNLSSVIDGAALRLEDGGPAPAGEEAGGEAPPGGPPREPEPAGGGSG